MAWHEITARKFRSALSMLGIVLGVTSLFAMLGLTAGIARGMRTYMQMTGGLEFVSVGDKEVSMANAEIANTSPGRTLADAYILRANVPGITHISPEVIHPVSLTTEAGSERYWARGTWPGYYAVHKHEGIVGRFLTDLDFDQTARVVVIGAWVAQIHFPGLEPEDILGRTVMLTCTSSSHMTVVGVLPAYESEYRRRLREREERASGKKTEVTAPDLHSSGAWEQINAKNLAVLIPLSTMFHEFKSGQHFHVEDTVDTIKLHNLMMRVGDLNTFRQTIEQANKYLEITHRGIDDFHIDTREEWFSNVESNIASTRRSGSLIALVSLVIGAIGIANIMLANVNERIREIGIRLAVGARGRDIFLQVLVESSMIAFIGGIVGIVCGMVFLKVLTLVVDQDHLPVAEFSAFVISVSFAVTAGILSGLYPALKASRLDPIIALRCE